MWDQRAQLARLFDLYGPLLSEAQAQAFSLHEEEDLSFAEIASELGISRQAASDRVAKARERLLALEEALHFARRLDQLATVLKGEALSSEAQSQSRELLLL